MRLCEAMRAGKLREFRTESYVGYQSVRVSYGELRAANMRAVKKRGQSKFASDLEFYGGRNRVRTCDPFRVKEVRSRCAIRPDSKWAGKKPAPKFQWLPG